LFSIGVPVPDQNIPMETNIIPDNKPGLLWSVLFFMQHEVHVEMWYVGYCKDLFLHDGAVTLDASTQWYITPALPGDVHNCPLAFL
jgi:hypothetical protein